jgi:hypothetical protein
MRKLPFLDFFIVSGKELRQKDKEIKKKDEKLYIRTKMIANMLHTALSKKAGLSGNAHRIR